MRDLSLAIPNGAAGRKIKTTTSTYRLNLAIVASLIILGLVYLFIVNSMGTKGYEIKKLDEQVKALESEQKNLQIQVSDLQSMTRIQAHAQANNFVQASAVYLKDSDVALK